VGDEENKKCIILSECMYVCVCVRACVRFNFEIHDDEGEYKLPAEDGT
jgi:hypothetical protein